MNKSKGVPKGDIGKYLLKFAASGKEGIKVPKSKGFTLQNMKLAIRRYPDIWIVATERMGSIFLLNMDVINKNKKR
jgi:hypothetical protein